MKWFFWLWKHPYAFWGWISLTSYISGEGNGNPLQCSCLENPRDGGAWWAAVYGVAQSRTRLKRLSSSSSSSYISGLQVQRMIQVSSKHLSFNYDCIIFFLLLNNCSSSIALYMTRYNFASILATLLWVLSWMSAAQKWAHHSSWGLNDAGWSALITSLFWVILVLLM